MLFLIGVLEVKFCDLDSACMIGELFPHADGGLKFTPSYVAPEIFNGELISVIYYKC